MRGNRSCRPVVVAGLAALAVSAGGVLAQNAASPPPGIRLTLDVLQSFQAGDNLSNIGDPSGDGTLSSTQLTFGLSSQTRSQSFQAQLGGEFRVGNLPDEGGDVSEFTNPFGTVAYARTGPGSRFSFTAGVRDTALRDRVISAEDLGDVDADDLVIDNGSVQRANAELRLATGIDGPVETDLRLRWNQTRYDSTSNTLDDRDSLRFDGSMQLAATRNTDIVLDLQATQEDRDDADDLQVDTLRLRAGVITDVTSATRLDLRIGQSRIDVSENSGDSSDTALTARAELRHQVRNGTYNALFESTHFRGGTRQTLSFARSLEFRRGALTVSVGATQSDDTDISPVVELDYSHQFRRGQLQASIAQVARGNAEGEESINTRASLRYLHALSDLAQLDLSLSITEVDQTSGTGDSSSQRSTASVAVNYALTEDWSLSAGYRYNGQETNGVSTLESNQLFANFRRSFDLRP